jgi:2'-5' RNA ligase
MERWRCFVAVPVPDQLRLSLAAAVDDWRGERDGAELRWTDAAGWHVTLAFLGWVDSTDVSELGRAMAQAAGRTNPTALTTRQLGAFPSPRRARVVWYGIADPERTLRGLADDVRNALEPLVPSVADQSPFSAHITLARSRDGRGADLSRWLETHRAPAGELPVGEVVLYRSHLGGRGPARYEALLRSNVGAPAAAGIGNRD